MALTYLRPRVCARRKMNMFYLIDTSGSMNYHGCIDSVNNAMPQIIGILRQISVANHDQGDIYLNCITFDSEARLLYERPVAAEDCVWAPLQASGLTNLGAAFDLLERQMHRSAALDSPHGHLRPAVILLSDGDPDDGWEAALERLRQNRWFRDAYKIAIAVGADAANVTNRRALSRFADPLNVGGKHNIIRVDNLARLGEVIRLVSATVSRLGSQSTDFREASVGDQVSREIHLGVDSLGGVWVPAIGVDDSTWL